MPLSACRSVSHASGPFESVLRNLVGFAFATPWLGREGSPRQRSSRHGRTGIPGVSATGDWFSTSGRLHNGDRQWGSYRIPPGRDALEPCSASLRTMKDNVTGKLLLEGCDQKLVDGVLARQTRAMAKAITLLESSRRDHQARAEAVVEAILPSTGRSIRLGISGSPGSGKSTFIEALGLHLIGQGHRVAVLAVDPSSSLSGGSILGDKTR